MLTLTDEQSLAAELFAGGGSLVIQAGAGTGKTSTLVELAKRTDRIGHYVAFNKAIVVDAGSKMPETVIASTAHSLAFQAVGRRYRHRLDSGRVKSWEIARRLRVDPIVIKYGSQSKVLKADYLAGLIMRTLTVFSQSADERPLSRHVPYVNGIDLPDSNGRATYVNNDAVRDTIAPKLEEAWADICDPAGSLPFRHDHYLKIWQLGDPRIPAEFILFDEAQDAAPVMLDAITRQDAQLVFVGDSQQQIYEWRGAIDALSSIDADHTTYLTQSFRFGPAIADVANAVLEQLGAELRLRGWHEHASRLGRLELPDAILTRTNATAVSTVLAAQQAGRRVHLVGGGEEVASFARGARELKEGGFTRHPELACFNSWGEVQDYVDQDAQGDELKLLVKLVDEFGVDVILRALDNMIPANRAEVVVSTAHKAKGREWPRVRLTGDFSNQSIPDSEFELTDVDAPEWRLVYVAATRGREVLDLDLCRPLRRLLDEGDPEALDVTGSVTP